MTTGDMFKLVPLGTPSGLGPAPGPYQTGSLVTHTSIGKQPVGLVLVKYKRLLCRSRAGGIYPSMHWADTHPLPVSHFLGQTPPGQTPPEAHLAYYTMWNLDF